MGFLSLEPRTPARMLSAASLLCALVCACTPIDPLGSGANAQRSDAGVLHADGGGPKSTNGSDRTNPPSAQKNASCASEGARSCTEGKLSRQPLHCESGTWQEDPVCNESQRCEPAAGPSQGTCVKLDRECIGRDPDVQFCQDAQIRTCSGGVSSLLRTCEAARRCVEHDDAASCECATGTVQSAGACIVATSCDMGQGGCDLLTHCTMSGTERMCTSCPDGFSGTGLTGCTPLLLDLRSAQAELTPSLSPDVSMYRMRLPLMRQQLTLAPKVAFGVQLDVNGQKLAPGETWSSDTLALGEHPLALTLTAGNGLSKRYELVVEHAGSQEAYIKPGDPDKDDAFGYSVAISGDSVVVGAPSEDGAIGGLNGDQTNNGASSAGAAYVFVRQGNAWSQQAYVKADAPEAGDYFGVGVAIDGDTMLVGMPRANVFPNDTDTVPARTGLVYVFMRHGSTWTKRAIIASPSSTPDLFGYSIALGKDVVLISAPLDSESEHGAGAVYVMARTDSWDAPLTKLRSSKPLANGYFGWSLALDQDTFIAGEPQAGNTGVHGPGAAYVFTRTPSSWELQQRLPDDPVGDAATFGWSVSLQGDTAAIGAPRASLIAQTPHGEAYLYQRAAGHWKQSKVLEAAVPRGTDFFGSSVVLAGDTLVVGVSGDQSSSSGLLGDPKKSGLIESGALFLFARQGSDWTRTTYIKSNNPDGNAMLGQVAAVSGDTIIAGAMNENSATMGVNNAPKGQASGSGAAYVFR